MYVPAVPTKKTPPEPPPLIPPPTKKKKTRTWDWQEGGPGEEGYGEEDYERPSYGRGGEYSAEEEEGVGRDLGDISYEDEEELLEEGGIDDSFYGGASLEEEELLAESEDIDLEVQRNEKTEFCASCT